MIAALSACACLAAKDSSALSSALPADRLALANQLSRRGLYADALNEYEALRGSKDVPHDEVLFRLGETYRLLDRRPDLMVSGINHGDNASVSVHYSGTVGAALEACMKNVPAIAFSLQTKNHQCDFRPYEDVILKTVRYVLQNGLPDDVLLNVNFPEVPQLKGTKVCRLGRGRWMKEMMQVGENEYRLTGYFQNLEPDSEDTDYWALDHGFASITPIQLDTTAHALLETLKKEIEGDCNT